ncbi:vesicle-associated membrane protein-associated protein B-like isoform X1 [Anopheles nili]|uniref:vesicle-associated membrane protein-associated protein B-like isoform X1 n=1 Tax=Anopheles nili TaxID=185578 RepID=UPI00237C2EBB|nr:vesicle-associated membrane protein-associated protein B-like isoform X1 [Anopheles nili]
MAKPLQLLNIEPATELKFQGPFRTAVASYMRLTNPTDHEIYFKIKTTAPKKYCVRPNCGLLEPGDLQEIAIVLQPFTFDSNEKNKHKFMVQSMVKPEDEDVNLEDLWRKYPEKLMDSKLRCVFECPIDSNQPAPAAEAVPGTSKQTSATVSNEAGSFVNAQPAATSIEEELQSESPLAKEVKKLRDHDNVLRQENLQLREQILQLRLQVAGRNKEQPAVAAKASIQSVGAAHYQNPYSPPSQQGRNPHEIYIAIIAAVIIAIVGVWIGKLVFSEGSK